MTQRTYVQRTYEQALSDFVNAVSAALAWSPGTEDSANRRAELKFALQAYSNAERARQAELMGEEPSKLIESSEYVLQPELHAAIDSLTKQSASRINAALDELSDRMQVALNGVENRMHARLVQYGAESEESESRQRVAVDAMGLSLKKLESRLGSESKPEPKPAVPFEFGPDAPQPAAPDEPQPTWALVDTLNHTIKQLKADRRPMGLQLAARSDIIHRLRLKLLVQRKAAQHKAMSLKGLDGDSGRVTNADRPFDGFFSGNTPANKPKP